MEEISRHYYYGAWKKNKMVVSSSLKVSCKKERMKGLSCDLRAICER